MDFRVDRNRTQICGGYNNVMEPEYEVVDDQEEVLNVRILPARPINDETEYADRDPPRSGQSLSLLSTANVHLACPPNEISQTRGPAINRDLKPGRWKTKLGKRLPPLLPGEQPSHRHPMPPSLTLELASRVAEVALHEPCRRDRQLRINETGDFNSHIKGPDNTENASSRLTNQRHSLDLESHDLDKRSHQSLERVSSRRHHEWPQTREDIDQHDFVPKEKPQTYYEEDWYVGACRRTDAEHALHLVNKDGAFLVRDCSSCTDSEPLVLVVYHEKKVYNVKIRFIESTSKYALGTGQRSNDMFDCVEDIIKFHSIFPIIFISGRSMPGSKYPENCVLTCPITKMDVKQLLQ